MRLASTTEGVDARKSILDSPLRLEDKKHEEDKGSDGNASKWKLLIACSPLSEVVGYPGVCCWLVCDGGHLRLC
jgi:hypothetical protein